MTATAIRTLRVRRGDLDRLERLAFASAKGRARFLLHPTDDDLVQEMVICLTRRTVVPPHRQKGRCKSYQMIRGLMCLVFFDTKGRVLRRVRLTAGRGMEPIILRFDATVWHTTISLTDRVIYKETLPGPHRATEWAPWTRI